MILDGKKVKLEKLEELKNKINKLDRKLCLCVIQVGDDPASNVYVKNKEKTALYLGCEFLHIKFDLDVSQKVILNKIDELNQKLENIKNWQKIVRYLLIINFFLFQILF